MPIHPSSPRRRHALALLGAAALAPRLALAGGSNDDAQSSRLVVVLLRGALDGLAAVPAVGDPAWAALRAETATGALPLDTMFALHPALPTLQRWYAERQLLVLHAIASPYRERSHFDAQQLLESGGERPFALATGWLGRALQAAGQPAVALSPALPVALRGAEQASTWTPTRGPAAGAEREDLLARIGRLYEGDAALQGAWGRALAQQGMNQAAAGMMAPGANAGNGFAALARQAGQFLAAERGPRVAWLESGGWDTHTQQAGRLQRQLAGLDEGLAALREGLGAQWAHSTVLVMTEFGRTAVLNGSGGTDHGTGGVALLAGGAVAGGRVLADWPGLAPAQLLDGRDLRPTRDIRPVLAALAQRQFGLSGAQLTGSVLPGVDLSAAPSLWQA